jgi:hypothetical protein
LRVHLQQVVGVWRMAAHAIHAENLPTCWRFV